MRGAWYLLREGVRAFGRHPGLTLAAILCMAASLLMLGLFLVFTTNVERVASAIDQRRIVDVYLADGIPPETLPDLGQRLADLGGVEHVEYISKDAALERFGDDAGRQGLIEALGYNPLPASFRLGLAPDSRTSAAMRAVAEAAGDVEGVEDVRFGEQWVDRLESVLLTMKVADVVMGLLVGLSAIFVVASTLRLTVLARQEMIEIMRVVGATDETIRTPFLVEGVGQSLVAGLLTLGVLRLIVGIVSHWVAGVEFLSAPGASLFLAFAAALGVLGSWISLRSALEGLT